jgi:hypothetical protein
MSWTRPQLERLAKLQLSIQQLASDAGPGAIGTDWLVQANECLTAVEDLALMQVERRESREVYESYRKFSGSVPGS